MSESQRMGWRAVRTCDQCKVGVYIGRQNKRDFYDCGHSGPTRNERVPVDALGRALDGR